MFIPVRRFGKLLALAVIGLAGVAASRTEVVASVPASFEEGECTGVCDLCYFGGRKLYGVEGPAPWREYIFGCADVPNCPCPCSCAPGGDDAPADASLPATLATLVQNVEAAVHDNDGAAISSLLAADERVEVNEARGAVQVVGCNDKIAASFSVSVSTLASLMPLQ